MTQPTNIYLPDNPLNNTHERSVLLGWQRSSTAVHMFCVVSVAILFSYMCWRLWHGELLALSMVAVSSIWIYYFRWRGLPLQHTLPSLLKLCRTNNGRCYIGGQLLPTDLKQVVLGATDNGPAYLQLAWNGSWQWLFDKKELPAVQAWLLQHYPHLKIVS